MRSRTIRFAALFAAFFFAVPALRAADKPMAPPKPAPEMAQLAYFAGAWACTGKAFVSPMGPEHPTEAAIHAATALDGFWYVVHYDEKKTTANPMPYHAGIFMGYEATEKIFVLRCQDSMGGYCSETSKGWSGDTFVFEGPNMGMWPKANGRDTFTKKGAAEMVHSGEIQGPDGKWMKMDEETCTKAAGKR